MRCCRGLSSVKAFSPPASREVLYFSITTLHQAVNECCARTLKRFIHYRDRWEGHSASEKLEVEQVDSIKQKIVSLEETMSMAKDFAWLMQARSRASTLPQHFACMLLL